MKTKTEIKVANEQMIDGEKAYPIYRVEAKLKYDGVDDDFVGSDRIYPVEPTTQKLLADVKDWWEAFLNMERIGEDKTPIVHKHPILLELKVFLVEYETWCLKWFSHLTYVNGRSDKELKQSLHKYVNRKLPEHLRGEKGCCLMGAEDYWRWKEPCHCKDCKKQGITIIAH